MLVRPDTNANDVAGFHAAKGILTSLGGKASHAALVARGMGVPCVTAASELKINLEQRVIRVGDHEIHEGDFIAINGTNGEVTLDDVPLVDPTEDPAFDEILKAFETVLRVGRRHPPARRPRQRGHPGRCAEGARAGRGGHRPVPHRAHVHGRGPPAEDAQDDHGRRPRRAPRRAGGPAAAAAGGLRGHLRGDEGPAGDDPPARPAAARVSARTCRTLRRRWSARGSSARTTWRSSRSCWR